VEVEFEKIIKNQKKFIPIKRNSLYVQKQGASILGYNLPSFSKRGSVQKDNTFKNMLENL